jgi:hypothetical protein
MCSTSTPPEEIPFSLTNSVHRSGTRVLVVCAIAEIIIRRHVGKNPVDGIAIIFGHRRNTFQFDISPLIEEAESLGWIHTIVRQFLC